MKQCPDCHRSYRDDNSFCTIDGSKLVPSDAQASAAEQEKASERQIPPPAKPLPLRLTIIDQADDGHRSRVIDGVVLDVGKQGMRIQTGTIETGKLHIIRDHTIAFKNRLELEFDLPRQTVHCTGFAAWFKPEADGLVWVVGVYIRDMPAADRQAYDEYLSELSSGNASEGAPA
jgi:eukaryotic-like serine/threonine-protein kinase